MTADAPSRRDRPDQTEGAYAWLRLAIAVALSTIGGVGLWSYVVALPVIQAEFAATRAAASLPFTLTMLSFGCGSIVMGRLADRLGIVLPILGAACLLGLGYVGVGFAQSLPQFAIVHGVLIGVGSAATFGPLIADVSHWFVRRRGIAVAICSAGNYLAGAFWPPVVEHFIRTEGWRATHIGIGVFCVATMLPLASLLRRRAPAYGLASASSIAAGAQSALRLSPRALQTALAVAGVGCCVAMAMPQVHLVAYCGDLGYGVAAGAEMLSLMLAFGLVSRVGSGFVADSIGGLATLLLGSALQGVALLLYLAFNGLASLYIISALFGLFQGGIVPMYAVIVRDYFAPNEAGTRIGVVLMATVAGMALGGWISGAIFDLTGSYRIAFANGVLFNALNGAIALWLLLRQRRQRLALA
jgi:MFS family permease